MTLVEKGRPKRWAASVAIILVAALVGLLALRESSAPTQLLRSVPQALSPSDVAGAGVSLVAQQSDPGIKDLGARWYFNWDLVPHDDVDLPFVPLVCGYPGDRQVSPDHLEEVAETVRDNPQDYPDETLFLIGNEIGYAHQKDGRTPREYAEDFHRCTTLLKSINPTFLASVGPTILSTEEGITSAIVDAEDGLDYLGQVIEAYEMLYGVPMPAEYFAATNHVMAASQDQLESFEQRLVEMRALLAEAGLRERSVILTEFGVPTRGSTAAEIEWFMEESIRIVATLTDEEVGHPADDKLVQRYAWFTTRPLSSLDKLRSLGLGGFFIRLTQTSLYNHDGERTHLGRLYEAMIAAG